MPHEGLGLRPSLQGHQRRDFLALGNAHPLMLAWTRVWVEAIAQLYRLNDLRLAAPRGNARYTEHDLALRGALQDMADQRARSLRDWGQVLLVAIGKQHSPRAKPHSESRQASGKT